ncbi:unnamed protein product [Closterium sp. NIES-54]
MFITLYFIVTRLPDSLRSVRDHFLSLDPTSLTVDLLQQHLLTAETSAVAVGAACGIPRPPFFEGCTPSPLAPSYASAAAPHVSVAEVVWAASVSVKSHSGKGKGGKGGGGDNGGGGGGYGSSGGGSSGGGGGGGTMRDGTGGGGTGARRAGSGGGQHQHQQRRSETQSPQQLREWFLRGAFGGSCLYVIRTGDRIGQTCGRLHTQHRCFSRLEDAWRAELGDNVELPRWADLLRSRIAIFDLEFNAILSAMYALSVRAEGDYYWCVPSDPGIAAAALGASESGTLPGTAPFQALHTFTLDSGTSACFFRESTTLTPPSTPVSVRVADPSGGLVVARSSTVLPSPAVPSGSLSALHLPSFSTNLVSNAALQDVMVNTTTPGVCTHSLPSLLRWSVRRARLRSGATGAGGTGAVGAGGAGVAAGARVTGGTTTTGPGGARTRGTGAAGAGGVEGARAGDPTKSGATGANGSGAGGARAGGAGVGGTGAGGARVGETGAGGAGAGGAGAVAPGGAVWLRPYFPASPVPAPSPYTEQTGGLTERREPESCPFLPVCTTRCVPRSRPPPVLGTHAMTLRPSSVPLRVPLPDPPASSLPEVPDPESDCAHAASPTISCLLATVVTDPSFESAAASALVAELLDFATACCLDYAIGLAAMDAEMASWKSTGTYVDEVPPPGANIVDGMWIFRGSLHEEIWLRLPPGFTESFPAGTQWSLRRPFYGLRQVPREWHDTLRTTLAALGFSSATTDPSLFLRTDTLLPLFYVIVYVDDLVFAIADTEALTLVKAELQKRHTCTDLGELRSYLGLQITRDRAWRTITLTQSHMVHQVLQRFGFQCSSPQPTPLSTCHSLSAPPSDESVELSGPYPELVGCLISSGMGLVLGGRGPIVLTGHIDASWVDDSATQWSSQGYTFSLGSGSDSWRSTRLSSVLSSSCEAQIYAGAMAAQELL